MYELWIKSSNGEWILADLPNEMPAINYSANDLAELNEKKYNSSQRIYLPITPTNQKIFDFVDQFDTVTDAPYKRFECRLLCNGVNVVGNDSLVLIHDIGDNIECQVLGGMINFITDLNMLRFYVDEESHTEDMRYLPSPLWHYRRRANIPTSPIISDTGGFGTQSGYGIFSSVKDRNIAYPLFGYTESATVPYVKFIPFLRWIFAYMGDRFKGIKLEYDIDGIDQIATLATGMKITEKRNDIIVADSLESFKAYADQNGNTTNNIPMLWKVSEKGSGNGFLTVSDGGKILTYKAPFDGSATFRCWMFSNTASGAVATFENKTSGTTLTSGFYLEHMEGGRVNMPFSKGDTIEITSVSGSYSREAIIEIEKITKSDGIVPVNGDVDILHNMGFSNASAYLQNMMQALGLFIHYDGKNKILHLGNASTIYKNRSKAKDWSKKLDVSRRPKARFQIGQYGRRNFIRFKEDKNTGFEDVALIEVKNENLVRSKDLFKLEFESGMNKDTYSSWSNGNVNIAAHTSLFDSTGYIGSGVPRIVVVDESIYVTMSNQRYPLVRHLRGDELIDKAYRGMVDGLLKRARVITARFHLTEDDVENINQLIPIYVSKFGKYYYVNKVKNFVHGFLTECELVEL